VVLIQLLVKKILRLAIPSIATFSSMTFTGLLVLMIVGKLGAASIAVVGITNILMYNLWAMFSGVQGSVGYLVAQNYGQDNMRMANQRMQIALLGTVFQSLLLFVASFLIPVIVLKLIGSNTEILELGASYFQVRMLALAFGLFSGVFYAYMRGTGNTRTPMMISVINSLLVVFFTYVLAYGKFGFPDLGLQGAAWGMFWAEVITALICVIVHFFSLNDLYFTRTWEKMELKQARLLFFESSKLSVTEMSNSLGMLVFTSCITQLGTVAIAANEIALNILSFGFMPSNGFGAAATVGIGQEIGRGKPAEAKRFGQVTVYLGLGFMLVVSLIMFIFALPIAKIYTTEVAVYSAVIPLIQLAAFIQLFNTAGIILGGGLRGVGDTTFLSRIALVLNWAIFVPVTVLLTSVYNLGQLGAWIALCSLMILGAAANAWRFRSLNWSAARLKAAPAPQMSTAH
jgi:multidrug resistance protein, MATE family